MVRGPLEPADLLPVALQPPLGAGGGPHVPLQDHAVPAARRQLLAVPRQHTWTGREGEGSGGGGGGGV